ncbi:MAG: ammonium transporter, partial [Bacteroidia bacterium]|nr:ammonium transporter [Bacteroidia bacterium]
SILWAIFGFSLAYGNDVHGIIGDSSFLFMLGVGITPHASIASNIPFVLFFVFQLAFAIITPALISGAIAERTCFKAYTVFIATWLLFVYSPVVHWVWGGGYLAQKGVLDFAGGLVIHLTAGVSAIAAVIMIGPRKEIDNTPCAMGYVSIGAGILWAGWFAFNGGSALAANTTAAIAVANTLIASSSGIFGWLVIGRLFSEKMTLLDILFGGIAGLIIITPMAGYVDLWCSLPVGFIGGIVCSSAVRFRTARGWDDTLDVWALHGIGGASGVILTGVFANPVLAPAGGILYGNASQLAIQIISVVQVTVYSFVLTIVLLRVIAFFTPLRLSEIDENIGFDNIRC